MNEALEPRTSSALWRSAKLWFAVGLVAVVVIAAGFWVWLTHLDILGSGNGLGMERDAGQTAYLQVALYPKDLSDGSVTIDITAIGPRIVADSSDATIEFLRCMPVPGEAQIGVVSGDLSQYCSSVDPWTPGPLTVGTSDPRGPYIIAAITPRVDGKVEIDGVDISYRLGIRSGTQKAGTTMAVGSDLDEY